MADAAWAGHQADALVRGAFAALFGRDPDDEGRRFYVDHLVHGRLTVEQFLAQLAASPEFGERRLQMTQAATDAAAEICHAKPDVAALSARLGSLDAGARAWVDNAIDGARLPADAIAGQSAYLVEHRQRFQELFHAAAVLTDGVARPRILEFGPSLYSLVYERLWPACRLVCADRPPAEGDAGFGDLLGARFANPTAFVDVDLLGDLDDASARLDRHGPYDLVVFTEVLEHLARHPSEIVKFLLERLAIGGRLYLTTPNALSHAKLQVVGAGRNPQQMPPRAGANRDAHYHVREYAMRELVDVVNEAGGRVRALQYSACWDEPQFLGYLTQRPDQRSNLVVVAAR